ncbi:glycosyltransferase family 9 protein [Oscillatoria sp. FACHB-1407]|uniref:glycosyltransferase family 9 protein n=1 Tax=Oscillatoria sp. FACHB-1407 TaxID=2692847 RepID=UPI00168694B6|nr:glycosyltransferase family 9 protein [Oscillatoria sp. FACHB-1407]MBD2460892.1 glycosyltransferase family 9 protein [Oscillatoria sp. FACHB-1407]
MRDIRQILFVELLGGIGDLLMALPAIHAVGRSHPQAQMTVLTFAPGGELLQHDPLVHRVVIAPRGQARFTLDGLLMNDQFDLIVSDTNYDGIADAIHDYKVRSPRNPVVVTNLWRSPPPDQRVTDRFLTLLLSDGLIQLDAVTWNQPHLYLTPSERTIARQSLGAAYRPLVVLCPDAGMAIKRWSSQHFITVGKALQQQYGATIVVPVGSDVDQATAIARGIGGTAQIWQSGSLRSFAAMLAEADLAIAADTGPARIAAALQVPTITLFGPSWHGRYGQPEPHVNLQGFPECPERNIANFTEQACWYSGQCPYEWKTCLEDISPMSVLETAVRLLNQRDIQQSSNTVNIIHLKAQQTGLAEPWRSLRNLLVMRLDNIGDVMMTSPVLRSLKENLPDARLTLMASPGGALTEPLLPWVDEVLPWRVLWQDLGRLDFNPDREWELIETLSQRQFDAAIILTSFSQSPHPAGLICALAGIPLRLGESKEQDLGTLTHAISPAPDDLHQVERNLRLIESVGFKVSDRGLALHIPVVSPLRGTESLPYLVLNPWTSCQSRNYFSDRFAQAARQLSEITGWSVVVTGVEKDRERATDLLVTLGARAIDLIGKTSLSELVALIAEAKLVLTNNTSTMHIADATGTPSVILFAGTELERQWKPRYSPTRLLRRPTVCNPCYAFHCPHELECLNITPEAVVAAALELLKE